MPVTATQTTVLFNDLDGDGIIDAADPIALTTGDTVRTTVVITNASGPDATGVFFVENGDGHLNGMTQVGNINVSPIAFNDTYNNAIGNTLFVVGTVSGATGPQANVAGNVLANDVEFSGAGFTAGTFQISSFQSTSAGGGTVVMETTGPNAGSFSYVTAAGYSLASDTFTYTVTDAGLDGNFATTADNLTSTATVTINLSGQVWYVDASAGAGGTGTSTNPFNTLASVSGGADADDAGDIIFVHDGTYTTGVSLENSQTLWGEGSALVVNGFTLLAAGADAIIDPGAGVGVTLATHNTLKGFTVEDTGTDISGADVGNLTISNVDLTNSGRLVNIATGASLGTVAATFDTAVSTSTAGNLAGATLSNLAGSITFNNAAISGTNGTGVGFDVSGGTANIDYNGSITETNDARTISVTTKTAGTVSFDGDVSSTGSADGIFLNSNTGAAINFTDTLTLTTSASNTAGFTATGGGTVTATGSGSTISSGTGTALNVANTTIGAADLTFQSISNSGGVNGIVLNTTGSLGGLTVTGTGTAGSGGTIANSTGDGILLTSTSDVVLQRMIISGADNDGIHGTTVNNFTFRDSTVSGFGNASAGASEDGMDFTNLTGTVTIQRSTIGAQQGFTLSANPPTPDNKGIIIRNDNVADMNMTVTGSTFTQIDNDGIDIEIQRGDGSLVVDGSTADGTNTFSQINGRSITFGSTADNAANGVLDLNVKNNTFNTVGIAVRWAAQGGTDINAAVRDNTMTAVSNDAVRALADPSDASFGASTSVDAIIEGNNFGGGGIFVASRRGATTNMLLGGGEAAGQTGNTNIGFGITLEANRAGILNVDVLNNTINANVPEPGTVNAALYVQAANSGGGSSTITAKISGNSFQADANDDPIGDVVFDNLGSTIRLEGWNGSPANDPTAFITGSNTFPADGVLDVATSGTVIGFAGDAVPTGGPSLGFLMAGSGGVEAAPPADTTPPAETTPDATPPEPTDTGSTPPAQPAPGIVATHLSQVQLDVIVSAAVARWEASGLTAAQNAYLQNITFNIADMSGLYLGATNPGLVTIDSNAAGYGWYVDANPGDDAEFANGSGTRLTSDAGGTPAGHIDLLTTVMHEMGHQLGLSDSYSLTDRDGLMYGYLVTGERRLPGEGEADGATPGSIAYEEFLVGPINIGTLPVGQTVTIQWDATIDAQSNALIANLSNQGTVTGNQPGAFSVNTDGDGGTAGIQQTLTVLDSLSLGNLVFWDKDANGLFDGADVGVNGVTLSLFVDANNDNTPDNIASPIATTTSAGGGLYSFAGIAPGHYIVRVDAGNFTGPAGALRFLQTSPTTIPEPVDPDGNVNNDDNGARTLGQPAFTNAITLTYNNEPTAGSTNDTNNTLDLGFTNIAPVLDAGATPTLTAINEDAPAPGVGAGTLVSQLVDLTPPAGGGLDNVTDADSTQTGIALTARDNTNGVWKYSLNGGTVWTNVPAVSDDSALLLASDADTRLYFQPNANFNGTSSITFRAWDQTDGNAEGATADPTPAGDSTAYSVVFDSAGITINAVNDAPQFAGLNGTPTFTENGPAVVLDNNATISDVDLDAANDYGGATLTLVRSTGTNPDDIFSDDNGTLTFGASDVSLGGIQVGTYTHVNGTLVITFDPGATSAQADSVLQLLTYRNSSDNPPASATINYTFSDGNSGAQGSGATPGLATGSVTVTITATNDAPVLDDNATPVVPTINEDAGAPGVGSGTLVSALVDLTPPAGGGLDNVTDVDNTVTGIALTAADNSNGTWMYSINGGANWLAVGAVTDDSARVLFADANTRVYFQPNLNFNGTSSITFRAWDRSNGSANGASGVDPSPGGGSTAFSAVFDSASVTVNSVNDQPLFAGLDGTPTYIENNAAVVLDNNALVADVELDAANNYNGATLTLVRSTGTNPDDVFNDDNGTLTFGATDVSLTGTGQVGTYTHVNGTLVITFDANATSAAVDNVLQQLTYRNTSENPTTPSVQINYTFNDGNAGSQGGTFTPGIGTGSVVVNITASNDAPTLDLDDDDSSTATGADYEGQYIPAGAPVPVADGDSLIGDVDDTNIESATITVANAKPNDLLSLSGGPAALPPGITVSGASTATNLILTGSASKAAYESAIELVRFSNSLANPDTTTRDITVVINDGNDPSNTAHASILINQPPTTPVDTDADADAVTEGAGAGTEVGIDANSTDPDVPPTAITYSLTTNPGGFFAIDSSGVVTVSAAGAAGINFETATSHNITVRATDGAGAFSEQGFTIQVNNVNPTQPVDADGAANTIAEGATNGTAVAGFDADSSDPNGPPVTFSLTNNAGGRFAIDGSTGVVTVLNGTLLNFESATSHLITVQASDGAGGTSTQDFTVNVTNVNPTQPVDADGAANTISEGAVNGTAVAGFDADSSDPNGPPVTFSLTNNAGGRFAIDGSTGVVTVLDSTLLNFESATSHLITVQASDGAGGTSTQDFTVNVTNVAPVATGDGYSTDEDAALNVAATGVLGNDSDVHGGTITAVLDVGPLHAASFTLQSDGSFSYTPTGDYNGSDSFTYHAFDGTAAGNIVTVNLTINSVVDIADDNPSTNEDTAVDVQVLTNDSFEGAEVVTAATNGANGTTTFDADSVIYTPNLNFSGSDSFTYTVTSGGVTETATVNVTVNSVNDAPQLAGFGDVSAMTENGGGVTLDTTANATVSDVELNISGSNFAGAMLTLARNGGPNADDTFSGTGSLDLTNSNGLGENVSLDAGATFIGTFSQPGDGTFSITFNATATAADINEVIRNIVYTNVGDNPPATAQIDLTFSDGNGQPGGQPQGSLGPAPGTAIGSFTVNITQINDAPFLLNVAVAASYSLGTSGVVISPALIAGDPDAAAPSPLTGIANATIKIESGFFAGDELFVNLPTSGGGFFQVDEDGDPLTTPVTTNIKVLSNALGQLVLSGNDTPAHYQLVLDAVSYRSTAVDPSNGGANPSRSISWVINDGALNSQTPNPDPDNLVNVTILRFNAPPTIDLDASGGGTGFTTTYEERAAPIRIVDTDISITDPDNAALNKAKIVLTNAKPGDVLSIQGPLPGGIDSSIDTSVPGQITITLTNSASLADYQTALGQIRFNNPSVIPDITDRDITIQVTDGTNGDSNIAHTTLHVVDLPSNQADFNADGINDVLLGQKSSGFVAEWLMNDGQIGQNLGVATLDANFQEPAFLGPGQWRFQDTGDFNSDGNSDILWRHSNGQVVLWEMDGSQITNNQSVAMLGTEWRNEGVGDFNADGHADVLWRNDITGQVALWNMDGAQITNNQQVAAGLGGNWHFQGLLDANGDGKSDVLLRDNSGQVVLWTMDGAQITNNQSVANLGLDWNIQGTGDFNGDGLGDVVLRNDSGQVVIWEMNGSQIVSNTSVATPSNDWRLEDVGDYNSDGNSDILWRNASGQVSIWEMDGPTITDNHAVATLNSDWTILNRHYDVL